MTPIPKEPEREYRITMEIVVDANGPEEQAMGWYYYLADEMVFPFTATCILKRSTSPLQVGDKVKILGMASGDECEHEMFVEAHLKKGSLAIPLSQVKPIEDTDEKTKEAVADWHYWVNRGYEL